MGEYIKHNGEKALLVAIVARAIADLELTDPGSRTTARAWLNSTSTRPWSYRWCCEHLGICADTVLRAIDCPAVRRRVAQQSLLPSERGRRAWQWSDIAAAVGPDWKPAATMTSWLARQAKAYAEAGLLDVRAEPPARGSGRRRLYYRVAA